MLIPGRHEASGSYRYGFQGQEKDDEIKGEGNSLNYTFRMHDPRVGKFFAVDPLAPKYPHNSPYAFSENNVINAVELEGLEKKLITITFDDEGHIAEIKKVTTNSWFRKLNPITNIEFPQLGVSYSFTVWATVSPYHGLANSLDDVEKFLSDPLKSINSNNFTTDNEIIAEAAQELVLFFLLKKALKSNKPFKPVRLPQDTKLGKNKKAPPKLSTNGRKIGGSENQNNDVKKMVEELELQGAEDIRIDQQQVNAKGEHVGVNRPDLQYTLNGKRHYVEWDTSSSKRGQIHEARIRSNDPDAGSVKLIEMN